MDETTGSGLLPRFNLVTQPWVSVVFQDGATRDVSLSELFARVSEIRELSGDLPQQVMPVLRLCEAVLYRAYGSMAEPNLTHQDLLESWRALWNEGSFDDGAVQAYLEEWADGFDLFGERPFFQVPGLVYVSKDKEFDPITELVADVPKERKFLFSTRARDAPGVLTFAEAARWLVFAQAYDCAGTKTPVEGNTHVKAGRVYAPKGLPGTGWAGQMGGTFLEGRNLFETLMLNWVMYDEFSEALFGREEDLPSWERGAPGFDYEVCHPAGPVSLYTWQSRRMRLIPTEDGTGVRGVISCYGDIVSPTECSGMEPMTAWRESKEQQKKLGLPEPPLMPRTHDCGKAVWRGLGALLARAPQGADSRPGVVRWHEELRAAGVEGLPATLGVHAQGAEYGTQSSVIVNMYDDVLGLGSALLEVGGPAVAVVVDVVGQTDEAVKVLGRFAQQVEQIGGDKNQGTQVADGVRERAFAELDELYRAKVTAFSADVSPDEYRAQWLDAAHRVLLRCAGACVASTGTSPFARRDGASVAEAWSRLRSQLDGHLGALLPMGVREGDVPHD